MQCSNRTSAESPNKIRHKLILGYAQGSNISKEPFEMDRKEVTESGSPEANWKAEFRRGCGDRDTGAGGGGMSPEIRNVAASIGMEKSSGFTSTVADADVIGVAGVVDGGGSSESTELMMRKKKRVKLTKYDIEEHLREGYMELIPEAPPGFSLLTPTPRENSSASKRDRGKLKDQLLGSTAGGKFTPHAFTVYTGEDIAAKILTFAQKGSQAVCILSANGPVSTVALRQSASHGCGLLIFQGCFEILTLRGSYAVSDAGGIRNWTGGLSISLAGQDGQVIGGSVAGLLMAASPIQIVVASFVPNSCKTQERKHIAKNQDNQGMLR